MKYLIILLLLPSILFAQWKPIKINAPGYPSTVRINEGYTPTPPPTIDYTKDIKLVQDVNYYEAFGFIERTGDDRLTYFYRRGTDHLTDGALVYRHYYISTDTWADAVVFYVDPEGLDMRDAWGGKMDNGNIVIFSCASEYSGGATSIKSHALRLILNNDLQIIDTASIFNGAVPEMQRGLPFGRIQKGAASGTYYIVMWQFNTTAGTTDRPTFPLYRVEVIKTTDYFTTWTTSQVYQGALSFSECVVAVWPDENYQRVLVRRDPGGMMRIYETTNGGSSWTDRGNINYLGLNGTKIKMPFAYQNSNGTIDFMAQDRDDGWLKISRNNTTSNFGTNAINTDSLWAFNRNGNIIVGDNYKLGYPSFLEIEPGKYFFVYTRQMSGIKANLYYSKDDFKRTSVPVTPNLFVNAKTATTALVYPRMDNDMAGYTLKQLENISYFEWAISTDNFETFVTCRVRYTGGAISYVGEINGYKLASELLNIYDLTTATTYQVRCRAVNNAGASDWNTTTFTTD